MSKNNTLSEKDREILYEVEKNARRSIKAIAKAVGMKRDTVAYRIKKLEEKGIIKGYYTLIDFSKLGYFLIRVYLKYKNTTKEDEEKIIKSLVEAPNTFTVYETEGNWDVAVGFLVKSLHEFNESISKVKEKFRKFIDKEETAIFLEYTESSKDYLVKGKKKREFNTIGQQKQEKITQQDRIILQELAKDGKKPLLEIAKKLRKTAMSSQYRIKQLEKKKIILGYKALVDHTKYGFDYYKIDFTLENTKKEKELENFAKQHPNIVFIDKTIGGSDFECDCEVQGYDGFYKIIDQIKKKFPHTIRTYSFYKARKIHKYNFAPKLI